MDLTPYYNIVENCITRVGADPTACKESKPGSWSLKKGSAKVWIDVWYIEKEGRPYIQVMSPVMKFPGDGLKRSALFEELLTINDKLFGCAFTIFNNFVWLKSIRECDGLDENEAFAMLTRIGNYADQYDDFLVQKYLPQDAAAYAGTAPETPGGAGGASDN